MSLPLLPEVDGVVEIPAQPAVKNEPRTVKVYVRYPRRQLSQVGAETGLMLSLHNWGGTAFVGAPQPEKLADPFNLVVVGVDYYQSGDLNKQQPYDFGYYQAMDALRGLYHVYQGLVARGMNFDRTRIYGAGGSGGGYTIQMARKFAPCTFACIVDHSGMASLTDDMAFNLPGGSRLNARYSQESGSPASLSKGMQEIRDLGNAEHLALNAKAGGTCKVVVIHGEDDTSCLVDDKKRVVNAMKASGMDVEPHYISKQDIDGKLVKESGHAIGDRTELLRFFAGKYLDPSSGEMRRLSGPVDFEQKTVREFPTSDGVVKVSYDKGFPEISCR